MRKPSALNPSKDSTAKCYEADEVMHHGEKISWPREVVISHAVLNKAQAKRLHKWLVKSIEWMESE